MVRRFVRHAMRDDIAGEAAKMSYFFFLSLFPLTLIVFALTGIVGGDAAFERIATVARDIVPDYAWQFVQEIIREIAGQRRPGVLSFSVILTYWAASNGIAALVHGLNASYSVEETRSWWARRFLALAIMVSLVLLVVAVAAAFIPALGVLRAFGLADVWWAIRWPVGFVILVSFLWLAYRFLPANQRRRSSRWTFLGASIAAAACVAATLAFQFYVDNFGRWGRLYGAIGAVIVLLLWFYMTALIVLAGAEISATMEQRYGK